ncbi:prolyl 4-hydroxylase subunit alpha-2-like [Stomoxys calcitrans]|uniref:procollagen-proline 4-dioxygenase n=1 Tax=Stomoxys calcitrans TaxID=35570 RepID=A0A1I8Q013_STOCA|nr:prolyl 4-hydroxylase subunit alpha-2-like [Stomoxys calcitrans]
MKPILNLVLLLSAFVHIKCDFYSSVSGLENLLAVEENYLNSLEKHLQQVEKVHNEFKSILAEIESEHSYVEQNASQYFDDPMNAFKIIRRQAIDIPQINDMITSIQDFKVFNESLKTSSEHIVLPSAADLKGAALGLSRLQKIYKLDTEDMAEGYLEDEKFSSSMSAFDCYILGRTLYEAKDYGLASEWLLEALHKTEDLENGIVEEDYEQKEEQYLQEEGEGEWNKKKKDAMNDIQINPQGKNQKDVENLEDNLLDGNVDMNEVDTDYQDEEHQENENDIVFDDDDLYEMDSYKDHNHEKNQDVWGDDDLKNVNEDNEKDHEKINGNNDDELNDTKNHDIEDNFDAAEEESEGIFPYVSIADILEFLPAALYYSGQPQLALAMNAKLLALDPQNKYAHENGILYAHSMKEMSLTRKLPTTPRISEKEYLYTRVCSGELQQSPREQRHLRCRLVTNNVPYFFVGPLKLEELSLDPFVAYYHGVIHDEEIDDIIDAASNRIERSKVGPLSVTRFDDIRVSKNGWLKFKEHRFLDKIAQRLEDITGLSIAEGEDFQVVNYGIGGHYGPHHDFFLKKESNMKGNRILTALFYINDVELGGATVFPLLRISAPPIKGSLLVWHNYHKSMEPDYRTLHAGCPVLQGSKWVCNEWFSTYGQELKRPCGLEPDDEISNKYKRFYN